jgi:hypothetical protein
MPYRSNIDLPPPVRRVLPAHAQDIYREAFNHAFATMARRRAARNAPIASPGPRSNDRTGKPAMFGLHVRSSGSS